MSEVGRIFLDGSREERGSGEGSRKGGVIMEGGFAGDHDSER